MIKTNDKVLTKKNTLCRVTSIRGRFALLRGINSDQRVLACISDLRTLKPFHGINIIV
jgi:hypothetical protein